MALVIWPIFLTVTLHGMVTLILNDTPYNYADTIRYVRIVNGSCTPFESLVNSLSRFYSSFIHLPAPVLVCIVVKRSAMRVCESFIILYRVYISIFLLTYFTIFLPTLVLCGVMLSVCCSQVWTLEVWGELACHKRLFNPPRQLSRLGTWYPAFVCVCVCMCVCVWWLTLGAHARGCVSVRLLPL